MERDRSRDLKPEELGALASELLRQLRAEGENPEEAAVLLRRKGHRELHEARAQRDVEARRRDEDARRKRVIDAILAQVLPPKVYTVVNGAPLQTEVATTALDWAEHPKSARILVLRGGMGVGKSVAAGLACKSAVEGGMRSISWHRPNDFVSAMLHAYDRDAPELGRDLVVIDDMGRETKADFAEALSTFLDGRGTRLIITTNDKLLTWKTRYDPRLIERIAEEGEAYDVLGDSRRQKGMGF